MLKNNTSIIFEEDDIYNVIKNHKDYNISSNLVLKINNYIKLYISDNLLKHSLEYKIFNGNFEKMWNYLYFY